MFEGMLDHIVAKRVPAQQARSHLPTANVPKMPPRILLRSGTSCLGCAWYASPVPMQYHQVCLPRLRRLHQSRSNKTKEWISIGLFRSWKSDPIPIGQLNSP